MRLLIILLSKQRLHGICLNILIFTELWAFFVCLSLFIWTVFLFLLSAIKMRTMKSRRLVYNSSSSSSTAPSKWFYFVCTLSHQALESWIQIKLKQMTSYFFCQIFLLFRFVAATQISTKYYQQSQSNGIWLLCVCVSECTV